MGCSLGFTAVLLQIAVFLQPLLPKQYQIAPVCETIAQTFDLSALQHHKAMSHADSHMQHMPRMLEKAQSAPTHDHHDLNHQCQYCTVYGHLILPPELDVKEILVRIQVRFWRFSKHFDTSITRFNVYFYCLKVGHRLYLHKSRFVAGFYPSYVFLA